MKGGQRNIKEFTVNDDDDGVRLDRFAAKTVPGLPASLVQKYIRKKRIKVGGRHRAQDYRLKQGDTVQMYINDEFFETQNDDKAYLHLTNSPLSIIYEDANIMLIDKPAGLLCHSADGDYRDNAVARVQAYLYKTGQWHPRDTASFTPALCNRIDRNTSGIVIAAKNAKALRIICEKIRQGEIDKHYLAIVHGIPAPPDATLQGYIFKDAVKNRVYVKSSSIPGAKSASMEYKTLETKRQNTGSLSLLECRLITGRTHQIRAQLASANHPILGDSKYGRGGLGKLYGVTRQALCSYKAVFSFRTDSGILSYLSGQSFESADNSVIKLWKEKCGGS